MEDLDFDKIINNAAQEERVDAPLHSWGEIHSALHHKKKKNRTLLWLLPLIASSFGIGYWLGNNKQQQTICSLPVSQHFFEKTNTRQVSINNIEKSNLPNPTDIENNKTTLPSNTYNEIATNYVTKQTINQHPTLPPVKENQLQNNNETFYTSEKNNNSINEPSTAVNALEQPISTTTSSTSTIESKESNNKNTEITKELNTDTEQLQLATTPAASSANHSPKNISLTDNSVHQKKILKNQKWKIAVSASTSLLTINNSNIFNIGVEKSINNTQSFGPANASAYKPTINALNATLQQLSIVANKNYKKTTLQLGAQLQYGYYNTIGYSTGIVNTNSANGNLIFLDLNSQNNFFGTTAVTPVPYRINGISPIFLKNHFLTSGIIFGLNTHILHYNKIPRVNVGLQLVPSYTLFQNVYWLDESNSRLFNNTIENRKVNLYTNMSLDYLCKIGKLKTNIGPIYSFSAFSLNKKNNNISNTNVNAIGIKFGVKL